MTLSISKLARLLSSKKIPTRPERVEGIHMQEGLFPPGARRLPQSLPVEEIVDKITTTGCSRSSSGMTVFIP